jgi:hypothetical protein
MKITLDLETNVITVPKNFFEYFAKQNDMLAKVAGDKAVKIEPKKVIETAFTTAMDNTDKYLVVRK